MKIEISPSIIAQNQKQFNKIYSKIKGAETIHLDIMDGKFVKAKSLWFEVFLPKHNYSAHLMTIYPDLVMEKFSYAIKIFIVHAETINAEKIINLARRLNVKIYFALTPKTPVSKIKKYLHKIDGVLVMTVVPGKYGAKFIPKMADKIKQLKKLKVRNIMVDGSVNDKTIGLLKKAGANQFTVGSFIQKQRNLKKAIALLRKA